MKNPYYNSMVGQIEEEASFEEYLAALHEYKAAGLLDKLIENELSGPEEELEEFACRRAYAAVSDALYVERLQRTL